MKTKNGREKLSFLNKKTGQKLTVDLSQKDGRKRSLGGVLLSDDPRDFGESPVPKKRPRKSKSCAIQDDDDDCVNKERERCQNESSFIDNSAYEVDDVSDSLEEYSSGNDSLDDDESK